MVLGIPSTRILESSWLSFHVYTIKRRSNRNRRFIRLVVRYASHVQYDKQGRIIIPDGLKEYSEIEKDVIIIGMINKIELWSPNKMNRYDSVQDKFDAFDDLADDISF